MFTAKEVADTARDAFEAALLYSGMTPTESRDVARVFGDEIAFKLRAKVQAHLSSDTTRIRPKRQA